LIHHKEDSARLTPAIITVSSASYPQAAKIPAFRSSRLRGLFAAFPRSNPSVGFFWHTFLHPSPLQAHRHPHSASSIPVPQSLPARNAKRRYMEFIPVLIGNRHYHSACARKKPTPAA
jgi:hypothetical protein